MIRAATTNPIISIFFLKTRQLRQKHTLRNSSSVTIALAPTLCHSLAASPFPFPFPFPFPPLTSILTTSSIVLPVLPPNLSNCSSLTSATPSSYSSSGNLHSLYKTGCRSFVTCTMRWTYVPVTDDTVVGCCKVGIGGWEDADCCCRADCIGVCVGIEAEVCGAI